MKVSLDLAGAKNVDDARTRLAVFLFQADIFVKVAAHCAHDKMLAAGLSQPEIIEAHDSASRKWEAIRAAMKARSQREIDEMFHTGARAVHA